MNDVTLKRNLRTLPELWATSSNMDQEIKFDPKQLNESNFKRMIAYYDSISSSPLEYLLTGALASLSGAVGKKVFFNLTKTMKIYLNVWAILIGKSTIMKKTTAINQTKDDLQRINDREYYEYKKRLEGYYRELEAAKKAKKTTNEIFLEKPIREYFLFPQDSTIESLAEILSTSSRGLLIHSEFGTFLKQFDKSYNSDGKQFFTTIYDVPDSYEISRITKENTLLRRPYLSILAASTIDWVKEFSRESDLRTGFLARFIYSIRNVPDKPYIPLLKLSELTKQSDQAIDTRSIYNFLTTLKEDTEISVTEEARELHINYDVVSFRELLTSENENELSFKARLCAYSLKFAALIALANRRFIVSLEDMEDSIQITEYYKANISKLLNTELAKDEFARKEDSILRVVERKGGNIKRSDLMNAVKLRSKELDEVISNLIQKELIEEFTDTKSSKKPFKFYKLRNN